MIAHLSVAPSITGAPFRRGGGELGPHPANGAPVWLKAGHYGSFVAHRRRYPSLSPDVDPDALALEQALALLHTTLPTPCSSSVSAS